MTKPLDEMTPEEIRLEIAERKGYTWWTTSDSCYLVSVMGRGMIDREAVPGFDASKRVYFKCPNWPESIEAAWELVEETRKICRINVQGCYDGWTSYLREIPSYNNPLITEYATTAPLAICKAWLAWKRGEE